MASLNSACDGPARKRAIPDARPSVVMIFIAVPLDFNFDESAGTALDVTSGRPAAPAQGAGRGVEPAVMRDHLRNALEAEAEKAEGDGDRAVDRIIVCREQRAA